MGLFFFPHYLLFGAISPPKVVNRLSHPPESCESMAKSDREKRPSWLGAGACFSCFGGRFTLHGRSFERKAINSHPLTAIRGVNQVVNRGCESSLPKFVNRRSHLPESCESMAKSDRERRRSHSKTIEGCAEPPV